MNGAIGRPKPWCEEIFTDGRVASPPVRLKTEWDEKMRASKAHVL